MYSVLLRSRHENATSNFVGCFVHYCPVQLISEVFSDCICVDTHLPRLSKKSFFGFNMARPLATSSLGRPLSGLKTLAPLAKRSTCSKSNMCLASRRLFTFCITLTLKTNVVIHVSSAFIFQTFAEVCYSVFVKRSSFKSLLNLRKAYIFQEFAEGLLSICVC